MGYFNKAPLSFWAVKFSGIDPGGLGRLHFKDSRFIKQEQIPRLSLTLTQLMKKAWTNLMTSRVTRRLMGIRLLKRMMKVRKFRPKLAAPPSGKRKAREGRGESGSKVTDSLLSNERRDGMGWIREGWWKDNNATSSFFATFPQCSTSVVRALCKHYNLS